MPTAMLNRSGAAAGIAWINSVGNLGGFIGPYAVGLLSETTHSLTIPMGALSASLIVAAILALRVPKRFLAGEGRNYVLPDRA